MRLGGGDRYQLKQVAEQRCQNLLCEEINPDLAFAKFQKADKIFAEDMIKLLILFSFVYHLFVLDSKYVKN